ncbi:FmdB family zinc ribbon protein [Agrococcus sp. Ld7]|uniref:FmdB family zinc ribbon protein n=1 Tax=Agrococcus sp. Ld7 TaxID=649148 RepID=UPI003869075F
MPVYAYACTACGHAFDARQDFSDAALTTCEACGGVLRKQYGSIGVSFNGPGFYRTDSRAAAGAGAQKAEASAPKQAEAASKPAGAAKPTASSSAASSGGSGSAT